jgi:predicted transcriptional regulator
MESLIQLFKDRVTHPFYRVYTVAWFVFNWNALYVLFYIDEKLLFEQTAMLKNEVYFPQYFDTSTWFFWLHSIIYPLILTILSIWVFPHLFIHATRVNEKFRALKKIERIQAQQMVESAKESFLVVKEKVIKKEAKIKKAEDLNPKIKWEDEFIKFKKSKYFTLFQQIIKSVYENESNIEVPHKYDHNPPIFKIDSKLLSYVHSMNLIEIVSNYKKINLTDKGMYFVRHYSEVEND